MLRVRSRDCLGMRCGEREAPQALAGRGFKHRRGAALGRQRCRVSASGVQRVVRVFFTHLTDAGCKMSEPKAKLMVSREIENVVRVVCDDELIEQSLARP